MSVKSDFKKITLSIKNTIEKFNEASNLKKFGKFVEERVRKRTRLGYGVEKNKAQRRKLKPLSPDYVDQRKKSRLSSQTSPRKSNLTKTGQMLDSLTSTARKGLIIVGPKGARRDSKLSNDEVSEHVSDQRPYLNLSNVEIKALTELMNKDIVKRLKR